MGFWSSYLAHYISLIVDTIFSIVWPNRQRCIQWTDSNVLLKSLYLVWLCDLAGPTLTLLDQELNVHSYFVKGKAERASSANVCVILFIRQPLPQSGQDSYHYSNNRFLNAHTFIAYVSLTVWNVSILLSFSSISAFAKILRLKLNVALQGVCDICGCVRANKAEVVKDLPWELQCSGSFCKLLKWITRIIGKSNRKTLVKMQLSVLCRTD